MTLSAEDTYFLHQAIAQARLGAAEGGVPGGAALVAGGRVLGTGRNRLVQAGSAVRHGEIDAVERAGRQPADTYRDATLYVTSAPCEMCTGLVLLHGIPRVVVGEDVTTRGGTDLLRARGVRVDVVDDAVCLALVTAFADQHPDAWREVVGHPDATAPAG